MMVCLADADIVLIVMVVLNKVRHLTRTSYICRQQSIPYEPVLNPPAGA